jgi:structure-specific endonuclease subunit SLX1
MNSTCPEVVYLLTSADRRHTYIGCSNNHQRRLRQHNGELTGGARSTQRHRPWTTSMLVRGFHTRHDALVFERAWKRTHTKGMLARQRAAHQLVARPQWNTLTVQVV